MTSHLSKPLATSDLARDMGRWAAQSDVTIVHVFGVDIVAAMKQEGQLVDLPIVFNSSVWSLELIDQVQASFRVAGQGELTVVFDGDVKPGDPGFELPPPTSPAAPVEAPPVELIVTSIHQPSPVQAGQVAIGLNT